jgi:outer membrane protein OmpA-like peptidoglycan-associated protein
MRFNRNHPWLSGAAALVAAATLSAQANADGGIALDRFNPAPAGDRMFGVESPYVAGDLAFHAMLLVDYAHNPYVLHSGPGSAELGAVVADQTMVHFNASIALWNRVNFNLDIPVALIQGGDSPIMGTRAIVSPQGANFGDPRFGLRVSLLGGYDDPLQIAIGGYVWAPIGDKGTYTTDEKVRAMPELILGGRLPSFVWSFAVGPQIRPSTTINGIPSGPMMNFGAGAGLLLGKEQRVQIGPEINAGFLMADPGKRTTNVEVLIDARYRPTDDIEVGAGVGPGLSSGLGTPDVRVIGMLAYSPQGKKAPADRDGDGVIDELDACPDMMGVASADAKKNGCPADRDSDGIEDAKDACPDAAGPVSDDAKKNGCPPPKDQDGDGILDVSDACPTIAGLASAIASENGCPGDTDQDGIRDDRDACPGEKGKADADPTKNGCPRAVRVKGNEIVILQQVQFDTGTSKIKKVSDTLLDEVAAVLKEHAEILKLEVQGHTDDRGAAKLNQGLSQGRATAVLTAMVKRGIARERLVAKGYGSDKPVADNATEDGRSQNRRVQFVMLERKAK